MIWIVLNESLTVGDPIVYKVVSIKLYLLLGEGFDMWKMGMLQILPAKAPLLWWIGQFIVPIGEVIGSVDVALRLLNIVVSLLSLWLFYLVTLRVFSDILLAILSCVALAAAPMFITLVPQFWTEPLQLLVVCTSLYLSVHAQEFSAVRLVLWFALVLLSGVLVKASMPLMLVFPAALATYHLIHRFQKSQFTFNKTDWFILSVLSVVTGVTVWWYSFNLGPMHEFIQHASQSDNYSSLLGAGYFTKFAFWCSKLLFTSTSVLTAAFLLFVVLFILLRLPNIQVLHGVPSVVALGSALQLLVFIVVSSFTDNQDYRYLLPMIPYFILLICYALWVLKIKNLTRVALLVFSIQLVYFHLVQFGIARRYLYSKYNSVGSIPSDELGQTIQQMKDLNLFGSSRVIYFATLPAFQAINVEYYLLRSKLEHGGPTHVPELHDLPVVYDLATIETPGLSQEQFWRQVIETAPDFIVVHQEFHEMSATFPDSWGWKRVVCSAESILEMAVEYGVYHRMHTEELGENVSILALDEKRRNAYLNTYQ